MGTFSLQIPNCKYVIITFFVFVSILHKLENFPTIPRMAIKDDKNVVLDYHQISEQWLIFKQLLNQQDNKNIKNVIQSKNWSSWTYSFHF